MPCACVHPVGRRGFLIGAAGSTLAAGLAGLMAAHGAVLNGGSVNLAKVAKASASFHSGDTILEALNDGFSPHDSADAEKGRYGNWPKTDTEWVQYDWSVPVTTDHIAVYWWVDGQGVGLPDRYRLLYWDGHAFVPVRRVKELRVEKDRFNEVTFAAVTTDKLRLEIVSDGKLSTGILEWQVWSVGTIPAFAPVVAAGIDRSVVVGGKTYLRGTVSRLVETNPSNARWRMVSGPGTVSFASNSSVETTANFSTPGDYVLEIDAQQDGLSASSHLAVQAVAPPPAHRLDVVYTKHFAIDNPLWNARAKALIVNWLPHVIAYCERTDLKVGEGGIDNFIEAGKANRGEPHGPHRGYVFSNAWVLESVEAMCIALMVDANGDAEIAAAQAKMRHTLERWIPIILAAQEPDGYLQTAKTLAPKNEWPERWSPSHRWAHEGYIAGYFIESAINHYTLTEGKDLRLYNAAKKLADCWVVNIGPGKKAWFDGHQEMEQALVRFGRFVNDMEGKGRGDAYIRLAQFLLESRRGGEQYDQSHLPPTEQYEAVGHAVRAVYFYSGMADIAAETGNTDYQSAVMSLWDNMVNRKYYVTGGVGSGETAEGFGPDYSLPHSAYCESCSSCGLIFFQYKMNLAYHDAKYADLYEQTLYNALLGSIDLDGHTFCYTNPLVNTERALWHVCPCCVANIPRTLLMLPTWTYAKDHFGLYVNLFIGSKILVEKVAGTDVEMVQKTDYPWNGAVSITVNPKTPTSFSVYVRIPDRKTSKLYNAVPPMSGYRSLKVNGIAMTPAVEKGYVKISRAWKAGDTIEIELPMQPQRITSDEKVVANRGRVALGYGPLVYSVETADQPDIELTLGSDPIAPQWRPDLLDGVVALTGMWENGSKMTAIPYYARMNRTGLPIKLSPGGSAVDYAPGAKDGAAPVADHPGDPWRLRSQVWIKA
jgi:uncharacterized protein